MFDTLRKCIAMMPGGLRARWLVLVPLTLVSTLTEAGTAAAVFALFQVLNDPAQVTAIPWVSWIVQRLPGGDSMAIVLQLMALAAVFHVFRTTVAILANYVRYHLLHEASAWLSSEMFRRYLAAPYPFHFHRNSAQLIRNCTTAVGEVMGVVVATALAALSEALVAVAIAVVLLTTAPLLGVLAGGVLLLLVFAVLRATRHAASRLGAAQHVEGALSIKTLQQAFGGIKDIKVLGREGFFDDEFAERQRALHTLGQRAITINYLPAAIMQSVMVLGGLALIAVIIFAGGGAAMLPTIGLFGYAALRLMPTATWMLNTVNGLRTAAQAANELYEDFVALGPDAAGDAGPGRELRHSLALERVSYWYPQSAEPALQDVTLTIAKGESIGIVGATGAGKSTLVDVLLGLLAPTEGRVLVDGEPVGADTVTFRRRVGYVPQQLFLIDDTLRRNLALGIPDADIDDARIREVVHLAQLHAMVEALPDGLDTVVGERGVRLSGGERQRIAMARALYHRPDLMVFDEATSALDLQTEAELLTTIDRLKGHGTRLVVAHRLTTVRQCDRVIFLRGGRVEAMGTFEELCRSNSDFRALAALAAV